MSKLRSAGRSPLVSVIVPAYDAAATLGRTLDSVRAQTYENLEILVVDDGSRDATRALALTAAGADPRIRVLQQPNGGVARARNLGLYAARGDYVAPLDADDLWHETKIERQLEVLLAEPSAAFVYCWFRRIDADDHVLADGPQYTFRGHAICRHALVNFVGNGSAILARRAAVLEVGGYDPSLRDLGLEGGEDWLLQLQLARRYPVSVVPEYLVGYRRLPTSMSQNAHRMALSHCHVAQLIARQCSEIPRRAFAWAEGPYLVDCAWHCARAGWPRLAAELLRRAVARDPIGASGTLMEIGFQRIPRRLRDAVMSCFVHSVATPRAFSDCDSRAGVTHSPGRLLAGRMRVLARRDAALEFSSESTSARARACSTRPNDRLISSTDRDRRGQRLQTGRLPPPVGKFVTDDSGGVSGR